MRALDRYDPDRGTRFSTYAAWWIRNGVLAGIERSREVHLPPKCVVLLRQIRHESERILAAGERPTPQRLAEATGATYTQITAALQAPRLRRAQAAAPPRSAPNPEDMLEQVRLVERLRAAARGLEGREKRVIFQRFGLEGARPRTLAEVGSELGLTYERARQIQIEGLGRLERVLAERQVAV